MVAVAREKDTYDALHVGDIVAFVDAAEERWDLFAAAVVLVHLSGTSGYWSELGAQVYFWGRLAYIPAYAAGIPWFRTILWQIASVGLVAMLVQVGLTFIA